MDGIAFKNNAARAGGFEFCFIDFASVDESQTKASRAAIDFGDVVDAADTDENVCGFDIEVCRKSCGSCSAARNADAGSFAIVVFRDHLHLFVAFLTTRSLQIPFKNEEAEGEEVQDGVTGKDREHGNPAGF